MRFATVLLALAVSMATQSCRIEMPSAIDLLGRYDALSVDTPSSAYDFRRSEALRRRGFKDTLIIGDNPMFDHGRDMRDVIYTAGVPEENFVFLRNFLEPFDGDIGNRGLEMLTSGTMEQLRRAARVVHIPQRIPLRNQHDIPRIAANNVLFVLAAGNMSLNFLGDRDQYNVEHILWKNIDSGMEKYAQVMAIHNTKKVISATSAQVTESGTVEPSDWVVRCGDIKEACFTVIPQQTTSPASARLSAHTFYLSQFWETPEEVVEALGACALDVGETGTDREYGRGVVNLLCPPVLKKEVDTVSSYLTETRQGETSQGGDLQGLWLAENTTLSVHIPEALQQTLRVSYHGTTTGTVEFTDTEITADFRSEAAVTTAFLLRVPLQATAEDRVQTKGRYTTKDSLLSFSNHSFTYTATKDSLHLIRSYSVDDVLMLLPGYFGKLARKTPQNILPTDLIQIRMSFVKEEPKIPGDFNEDRFVDFADFLLFVQVFGATTADPIFNESMDLVEDGMINFSDFLVFVQLFEQTSTS